jgi:ERCC4-type nuclease
VDSREWSRHSGVIEKIGQQIRVEKMVLDAGDFIISSKYNKPLVVERKTTSDLVNSLRSRRLFTQLHRVDRSTANVCLLLEGSFWAVDKFRKWAKGSLMRLMDTIIFDFGIPILPSYDEDWTADWLILKAKELDSPKEPREFSVRFKPKGGETLEEICQAVVEGFPGVGPSLAKKILQYFGSIENFIKNVERVDEIEGIGKKLKNKIVEVVRHECKF